MRNRTVKILYKLCWGTKTLHWKLFEPILTYATEIKGTGGRSKENRKRSRVCKETPPKRPPAYFE